MKQGIVEGSAWVVRALASRPVVASQAWMFTDHDGHAIPADAHQLPVGLPLQLVSKFRK